MAAEAPGVEEDEDVTTRRRYSAQFKFQKVSLLSKRRLANLREFCEQEKLLLKVFEKWTEKKPGISWQKQSEAQNRLKQ